MGIEDLASCVQFGAARQRRGVFLIAAFLNLLRLNLRIVASFLNKVSTATMKSSENMPNAEGQSTVATEADGLEGVSTRDHQDALLRTFATKLNLRSLPLRDARAQATKSRPRRCRTRRACLQSDYS